MNYIALASGNGVIQGGQYEEVISNTGFVERVYLIGRKLIETFSNVYEMIFDEYTILGISFSIFDLIFGAGICTIIGIIISKWITS